MNFYTNLLLLTFFGFRHGCFASAEINHASASVDSVGIAATDVDYIGNLVKLERRMI